MAVLSLTPSPMPTPVQAAVQAFVPTSVPTLTVHVAGAVDPDAVDALRDALVHRRAVVAPEGPAVDLDLREVTEFPRLAVAVLVAAHRTLGRRLRILGNPSVRALVEDAGLAGVLPLTA